MNGILKRCIRDESVFSVPLQAEPPSSQAPEAHSLQIPKPISPRIGEDPIEHGLGPTTLLDYNSILEAMEPLGVHGMSTYQPHLEEGAPGLRQGGLPPIINLEGQSKTVHQTVA